MRNLINISHAIFFILIFANSQSHSRTADFPVLNIVQAFQFNPKVNTDMDLGPFGHLLSMKINGIEFKEDFKIINPMNNQKENIAGVLSSYYWSTELMQPMKLGMQISRNNLISLNKLLAKKHELLKVEFDFQIYKKNKKSGAHFIFLKSFTYPHRGLTRRIGYKQRSLRNVSYPIKGHIKKLDNKLAITTNNAKDKTVPQPENYSVEMTIFPEPEIRQDLVYSPTEKYSTQIYWGETKPTSF